MPNRLASETSPYLLEHADNPVDWYPWGDEALGRAKREDRPIFLSIGYSACHWCHVMAHESFENDEIARLLNDHFVSIKVDREERPDLDQIYMTAVQIMTGRGGWPMSVFLTPDLEPFYGGTYWPATARMGMPGFDQVLNAVIDAWKNRRDQAQQQAGALTERLRALAKLGQGEMAEGELKPGLIDSAVAQLERLFDYQYGGFGGAPKFPHPMDLRLLLRAWARQRKPEPLEMVTKTLDKMAAGGLYDHLGGGFHRYSVDERWLVPHFEKMLYDNALLAGAYLEGYQATGNDDYAQVLRETCDYVLREMTDPAGGFYSTQDADSEGVEGKFYVWTPGEVKAVLGDDRAHAFCYVYDVSEVGNFEGSNILNRPKTIDQCAKLLNRDAGELAAQLAEDREKLLAVRERRIAPRRDDKVLAAWNGLMIDALAAAATALDEPRYLHAARRSAEFILGEMRRDDGRLLHSWRLGRARFDAYLDDYTCLANALVTLYENTFEARWIDEALRLVEIVQQHFADPKGGGYFFTSDDHEQLIARQKDVVDSSVPSSNAMAATVLLRLGKLTGRGALLDAAESMLKSFAGVIARSATATGQLLLALDGLLGPFYEIAVIADPEATDTRDVLGQLARRYVPNKAIALRPPDTPPEDGSAALAGLFAGKMFQPPGPTVYVCQDFTCQEPVSGKAAVQEAWEKLTAQAVIR